MNNKDNMKIENAEKTVKNCDEQVGKKYMVLDAKTGQEKKGEYFVLKLDADDRCELLAVRAALCRHCKMHRLLGNEDYAGKVYDFAIGRFLKEAK